MLFVDQLNLRSSPAPITPRSRGRGFLDFDDLEVARQLTLLENEWFKQIQPTECLNQAWIRDKSAAPNVLVAATTIGNLMRKDMQHDQ